MIIVVQNESAKWRERNLKDLSQMPDILWIKPRGVCEHKCLPLQSLPVMPIRICVTE